VPGGFPGAPERGLSHENGVTHGRGRGPDLRPHPRRVRLYGAREPLALLLPGSVKPPAPKGLV
jgi:hypothetical protein